MLTEASYDKRCEELKQRSPTLYEHLTKNGMLDVWISSDPADLSILVAALLVRIERTLGSEHSQR